MGMFAGSSYVLDNDAPTARQILGCLSLMLDEFSIARLAPVVPVSGRCLELGAGNGSVACWLAERVGRYGDVIATDVKTRHIRRHPVVTMLRHDLAVEELPAGPFDVVHARLLLAHLPSRLDTLARLVGVLRPGGLLVVEEFGYAGRGEVLAGAGRAGVEVYQEFQQALADVHLQVGWDADWAVDAHAAMRSAGLSDVDTVTHARSWRGGSAGCLLSLAISRELRQHLIGVGMVAGELDHLADLLTDPALVVMGDLLWSHLGRRPDATQEASAVPATSGRRERDQSDGGWPVQAGYPGSRTELQ